MKDALDRFVCDIKFAITFAMFIQTVVIITALAALLPYARR